MTTVDISYLLEMASRCRRLSREATDPKLKQQLLEMADEFKAKAASLGEHGSQSQM